MADESRAAESRAQPSTRPGSASPGGSAPPRATCLGPRLAPDWPRAWPVLLLAALMALGLFVYRGALNGPFLSDDHGYLTANPYTAELSAENLVAMVDPFGPARFFTANYAPAHLLLHAVERHIFADRVLGYHLVNVAVHALASLLLVALLLASRLPPAWALLGGVVFAAHPANVEAVAWISQLKTNGSVALALAAVLAHRRHPALSAPLFALGLLTKASALFALPMAAALTWARRGAPEGESRQWGWLGVWAAILAIYSVPELSSFGQSGGVDVPAYDDAWVQLRTIAAVGTRYLVMGATSIGVSAFQEPPPALSWLHAWWLAALPLGVALAARLVWGLALRREEAAWWLAAAAAFGPVSQIFPFLIPVADRYLYALLPGLIGGALLLGRALLPGAASALQVPAATLARAALALGFGVSVFFAWQASERASLWRDEVYLLLDAAQHYPDGATAAFLRARSAAQLGDVDAAVAELRSAADRGLDTFMAIRGDPGLAPIRGTPQFRALIHEMAGTWLDRARERGYTSQAQLRAVAHAHLVREEEPEAEAALERALRLGGLQDESIRTELEALRARRAGRHDGEREGGRDRPKSP